MRKMDRYVGHLNLLKNVIWIFILFGSINPTLRALIIGPESSESIGEYIFSALPDILMTALLVFSFIILFRYNQLIRFSLMDWAVSVFIVLNVLVGIILAGDVKIGIYGFRLTYFPVLFYFILRFHSTELIKVPKFTNHILMIFLAIAIAGVILYFAFYDIMISMVLYIGGVVSTYFRARMTSVLWTPVVFGTFMMAGFIFYNYKLFKNASWPNYFFFAIFWGCVLMSGSRGAILASFISFLILFIIYRKWKVTGIILSIMAVLFLLVSWYETLPAGTTKFSAKRSGQYMGWIIESTVETASMKEDVSRVELWKGSINNFKDRPWGYGLGKAGHVAARFYDPDTNEASIYSTDGWFLKIINETGIVGLLSYLFLAVVFLLQGIKYIRNKAIPIFIFFFVLFLAVNAQNLVSNVLDFYLFAPVFWIMIGMAENLRVNSQEPEV